MPAFLCLSNSVRQAPVKFSGLSNFQELGNAQELRGPIYDSWELGAAPDRLKLEKFRKFIYNKRGNININIFTTKLNPCQIFGRNKKDAFCVLIAGT